jgi:hypothetical protein
MRKIIFLDIDGVLAIPNHSESGQWCLSDEKQELLGQILDATGAEIVLSSSWRYNTLEYTKEYMKTEGFKFCEKLVGVTIRGYKYIDKSLGIHLGIPRGVEIKQWIDTNIHSQNGKNWEYRFLGRDYQYVILDDDCDMLLEHQFNFVRTDGFEGLSKTDVLRAIEILNKEEK